MKLPRLILFGGLGNQLFQYAYALRRYGPGQFEICGAVGSPRLNQYGVPELYNFNISEKLCKCDGHTSLLVRSIVHNLLKLSSRGRNGILAKSLLNFLDLINCLLAMRRSKLKLHLGEGIGYFDTNEEVNRNEVVIGCFHSYVWASQSYVRDYLKNLKIKEKPDWLMNLEEEYAVDPPVIVHIRRSDYTSIPELGFVPLDFFWREMAEVLNSYPHSKFWLFSDDIKEILTKIPPDLKARTKFMDKDVDNAAAHLMAMRLGNAFILSNSTFSWWGAFLSNSHQPMIRVPNRWYKSGKTPHLIYPAEWELIDIE